MKGDELLGILRYGLKRVGASVEKDAARIQPIPLRVASELVGAQCTHRAQELGAGQKRLFVDPSGVKSDLIRAANLKPLSFLQSPDEVARVQQAAMGSGVEPGKAAPQLFDPEFSRRAIALQKIGDLELPARGRRERISSMCRERRPMPAVSGTGRLG